MTYLQDAQALTPSAKIELFELDATAIGGTLLRFTPMLDELSPRANIVWQGNTYTPYPIKASGFEWTGKGTLPRPTLATSNLAGFITALCLLYGDLIGAKVTRKTTLAKYLDAVNFDGRLLLPGSVDNDARAKVGFDFTGATLTPVFGPATITFTRSGATATRVNAAGFVEVVAADTPRFDYDPLTLLCKGLLIEEARTNLCLRSAEFDNAVWTKQNSTVTANTQTAPDGTIAADTLTNNSTNGEHRVYQNVGAAAQRTISVYAASGTAHIIALSTTDTNAAYAEFGLDTGVVISSAGGTAKIEPAGQSFYRCSFTEAGSAGQYLSITVGESAGQAIPGTSYVGTGKDVWLWGAQAEQVSTGRSSYIPTTSATVTRNADWPRIASLGSWFAAAQGTITTEFDHANIQEGTGTYHRIFEIAPGTGSPLETWIYTGVGVSVALEYYAKDQQDNTQVLLGVAGTGTIHRSATVYQTASNYGGSFDGAAAVLGSQTLVAAATSINLGCTEGPASFLNGHLRNFYYFPVRLANATLQSLSTNTPVFNYYGMADPNAHWPDEIYYVDRKAHETKLEVSFELTAAWDVEGKKLPGRFVIQNVCPWVYRSAECSYAGGPVAKLDDTATSDPNLDDCGLRLASCKLRFGANNQLPYGGFPSVGLVR